MPTEATPRQLRGFALLLLAMAAIGAWRFVRRGIDPRVVCGIAGALALVGLVGLVAPRGIAPVYRGWMAVGHAMGLVTTPVVLTVVYLLVFTPVRLVMALFGKDPLTRRWNRAAPSYWVERTRTRFRPEDFEHLA